MMLQEVTPVPVGSLPLQALKEQLRLGTGFGDDSLQDAMLESHLRAAIAMVEGRTSKALISRNFRLTVTEWRDRAAAVLPLAPVSAIVSVTSVNSAGQPSLIDSARYRLAPDLHSPRIEGVSWLLPAPPDAGRIEVLFSAGFGNAWSAVPADLAQAVLILASELYERRFGAEGGTGAFSPTLQGLMAPWRRLQLSRGVRQ